LSIVGASIGPALANSMQENPPAATAKPADIFKASRRLKFGMGCSLGLAEIAVKEYRADPSLCQQKCP
jgi:hypothetical protein